MQHVILFDGECGLCNAWVDFVLRADRKRIWRFGTLQRYGNGPMDSVVVRVGERTYTQSDAVLQIFSSLGLPYSLAAVFRTIPRPLRDAAYRWIARNRNRWFPRRETCRMPTPEERERFLP